MNIEQINDKQIKCVLNPNDLECRNITISDFTYGSAMSDRLFGEITKRSKVRYGFNEDNLALMIEAIPLPNESLVLLITAIEDPEELDTRFSKFSPTPDDVENAVKESHSTEKQRLHNANEIFSLLSSFKDALVNSVGLSPEAATTKTDSKTSVPKPQSKTDESPHKAARQISLAFSFENIDKIIALSKILVCKYRGKSSLYEKNGVFYLIINNKEHCPQEFNQICNIICEYGTSANFNHYAAIYFSEHCNLILKDNALNELSCIE